jgi:hypothetical protein
VNAHQRPLALVQMVDDVPATVFGTEVRRAAERVYEKRRPARQLEGLQQLRLLAASLEASKHAIIQPKFAAIERKIGPRAGAGRAQHEPAAQVVRVGIRRVGIRRPATAPRQVRRRRPSRGPTAPREARTAPRKSPSRQKKPNRSSRS